MGCTLLAQVILTLRSAVSSMRRLHSNHDRKEQDLCRYKEEPHNYHVLWPDNDVTVYYWPIFNSKARRWVSDQAMPAIHTYFNTLAQQAPPIPLDAYRICIFSRHRPLEVVFTTISLVYGTKSPLPVA